MIGGNVGCDGTFVLQDQKQKSGDEHTDCKNDISCSGRSLSAGSDIIQSGKETAVCEISEAKDGGVRELHGQPDIFAGT